MVLEQSTARSVSPQLHRLHANRQRRQCLDVVDGGYILMQKKSEREEVGKKRQRKIENCISICCLLRVCDWPEKLFVQKLQHQQQRQQQNYNE